MSGPAASYCFAIFDRPRAPWRPTKTEAQADAIDAGYATPMDEGDGAWMTVPADIWVTFDPVETIDRGPAVVRKKGPSSEGELSRIERIIARREASNSAAF